MNNVRIQLNKVRLSFPCFTPNDGEKYSTHVIYEKDGENHKKLVDIVGQIMTENGVNLPPERLCISDGQYKSGYTGYEGNFYTSCSNHNKPSFFEANGTDVENPQMRFYSGCYVDVIINVWFMDN